MAATLTWLPSRLLLPLGAPGSDGLQHTCDLT
jgi:hypothetical protein